MARDRNASLNILIKGNPAGAVKAMGAVEGRAVALTTRIRSMTARLGGMFALVFGGRLAIDEAEKYGSTLAQTEAVITSTGNAAQYSAKQQADYVAQLERKAAVDREIINEGANVLRTFTKINGTQTFERALGVTLDMSAALKTDLQSAVIQVGKALNDPIAGLTSLTRSGIQFTDQQKEQIRTLVESGKTLEAQGVILDELETQFGGAAAANADASERGRIAVENLAGSIGRVLLPALDVGARGLAGFAGFFEGLPRPVQTGTVAMVAFLALLPRLYAMGRGARDALDLFRLGLAGVTERGAGASNAMGGLINRMGGARVAAVAATGAIAALAIGIGIYQQRQAQAKAEAEQMAAAIRSIREEAESTGKSIEEVFRQTTIPDMVGENPEIFKQFKIDVAGLADAVTKGQDEWEAWRDAAVDASGAQGGMRDAVKNGLDKIRDQYIGAQEAAAAVAAANEDLGNSGGDAADGMDEAAESAARYEKALQEAKAAAQAQIDKHNQINDAELAVVDAHEAVTDAQDELAEARRAAAGDSDEYRSAVEAVADAEQGVQDAQDRVAEAQRGVLAAQRDVNDARADAADRLREMAQATRDAALAEEEARLRVAEARAELERKLADPRATALEKERAELELRKAQEDARQAGEDRAAQDQKNAQAQAAGVEGDKAVIDAKARLADAERGVVDAKAEVIEATGKVRDAEQAAAKVISDAQQRVVEASEGVVDAKLKEIDAWADLKTAQDGAAAGALVHLQLLGDLERSLDPSSPLRTRIQDFMRDLRNIYPTLSEADQLESGSTRPTESGTIRGDDPASGNRLVPPPSAPGTGDEAGGNRVDTGSGLPAGKVEVNLVLQGTPTQQRRAAAAATRDTLDELARTMR